MLKTIWIGLIVEGHGEVQAAPVLLRRVAQHLSPEVQLRIANPIRRPKSLLQKPTELERAVELAAKNLRGPGGIMVLLDADDDCPAELGPTLLGRVRATRSDVPACVVIAKKEYEAWFLAAAPSLAGYCQLQVDLEAPADPEGIRGAKEWLSKRMPQNRPYAATTDQATLSRHLDISCAKSSSSFRKLIRSVEWLLGAAREEADKSTDGEGE